MSQLDTDLPVAPAAQLPVTCPLVEDLLWGEIDDKGHLERLRDEVYPAIERGDGWRLGESRPAVSHNYQRTV